MDNIVLVKVDDENARFGKQIPLGLLYVGSTLESHGFEVRCLDVYGSDVALVLDVIMETRPAWVGFSFMAGPSIKATMKIAEPVHDMGFMTVCGGVHPTILPDQCLKSGLFDVCVRSEGEGQAVELALGKGLGEIDGIAYLWAGEPIYNRSRSFMTTEELDQVELDFELVDLERYLIKSEGMKRGVGLVASRGCPHACGFCSSEFVNRRRWRGHSVEYVVRMVERLVNEYGIDAVSFLDENFFVRRKWAFELGERLQVPWGAATHIEYVDDEFVDMVERTKCMGIAFGLESGCDRVLKLMGKKTTKKSILERAGKFARLNGFKFSACVIFRYPTETWDELKETLRVMMELLQIMPRMTFACGRFLPFPGCGAYELAIQEGYQPPKSLRDWDGFDRWGANDLVGRIIKYVIVVQAVYKRWPGIGRIVGWMVKKARRSMVLDMLVWARERASKWRNWLGGLLRLR